jgi:hypothetical protein
MRSVKLYLLLLTTIMYSAAANAQGNSKPVERLGIAGPVKFDNKTYNFVWSSHPTNEYYKQEYIQKGENLNKFTSMFMVEVATGTIILKNAVDAKIAELKALQATNPFISYESMYDSVKKEYFLDFLITQNSSDGKSAVIAERNIYRYKVLPATAGKPGIMLFAISTRSYGAETKAFLAGLKTGRSVLADKMRNYILPAIIIK